MSNTLIPEIKGMKRESLIKQSQYNGRHFTEVEQVLDYNDDEIIFTATIKMNIKDKECKKMLLKMEEKQTSPLVQALKKIESEQRHDVKYEEDGAKNLYQIPKEIKKAI